MADGTPGELVEQAALVTGASSGIGEATAKALAAKGAHVVNVSSYWWATPKFSGLLIQRRHV